MLILVALSLRQLAHYLARYDGGRYAKLLLEDDIHQINADKIGITRRQVKTVTYAFLYGAGDEKIGYSYDPQLSSSAAKRKGKEIRSAYVSAIDGLADLLAAVAKAAERGYVKSIDGRKIALDSPHKALNYLPAIRSWCYRKALDGDQSTDNERGRHLCITSRIHP